MAGGSAGRVPFSEIIPNLTVVHGVEGGVLDMIEPRVLRRLPITTSLVQRIYTSSTGSDGGCGHGCPST